MNPQNQRSPHSQLEPQFALPGVGSGAVKTPVIVSAADRLYQVAALAAGIFLLATLL
ncbi:MAG TPA: hypothetical protein VHW70_10445 [Edaphobacter sp.]|jgi:hypothetical protein|nr:hypothetical protein [Edaphobacter sp.]